MFIVLRVTVRANLQVRVMTAVGCKDIITAPAPANREELMDLGLRLGLCAFVMGTVRICWG